MIQDFGLTARQRLYKDIKDVGRLFGTKYDKGIKELLQYKNSLKPYRK